MEDARIVSLYFARDERAIVESERKYGGYCYRIAYNILSNREDAQERLSDTWFAAWNAMPPSRPTALGAFLGRITRNLSISHWRRQHAGKRGGGELPLALEELGETVRGSSGPEDDLQRKELAAAVDRFLRGLSKTERDIFLCRYWYLDSVEAIARSTGFTRSKTASLLHRLRGRLRSQLEKEGLL